MVPTPRGIHVFLNITQHIQQAVFLTDKATDCLDEIGQQITSTFELHVYVAVRLLATSFKRAETVETENPPSDGEEDDTNYQREDA